MLNILSDINMFVDRLMIDKLKCLNSFIQNLLGVFAPVLVDGFSLKFERQQVSSTL